MTWTLNAPAAHGGHPLRPPIRLPPRGQIEAAADMFQALADSERLRLLLRLAEGGVRVGVGSIRGRED